MSLILLDSSSAQTQTVSDSVTPTDVEAANVTKVVSDSVTVTDSVAGALTLLFSDSVSPTDAEIAVVGKTISDSTSPTDVEHAVVGKTTSDSVTVTDLVQIVGVANITETIAFTDIEHAVVVKALTDSITPTDVEHASVTKVLSESISVPDSIGIGLTDSVTVLDSQTFVRSYGLAETIGVFDTIEIGLIGVRSLGTDLFGPVTGGKALSIVGPDVDESGVQDRFLDPTLDPTLWDSPVLAGSGSVLVLPRTPRGVLQLSTGLASSSSAILRSARTFTYSDAKIDLQLSGLRLSTANASVSASLGLYASATSYLRLSIDQTRAESHLRILVVDGVVLQDVSIPITVPRRVTLRLLRAGSTFIAYMNDMPMISSTWTSSPAKIEIGTNNGSLGTGSETVSVQVYDRNPVILLGAKLMTTILGKSEGRVDGLVPAQFRPGPQTIHVYFDSRNESFQKDLTTPYVYTPVFDYSRVGVAGPVTLTAVSDTAVRNS